MTAINEVSKNMEENLPLYRQNSEHEYAIQLSLEECTAV